MAPQSAQTIAVNGPVEEPEPGRPLELIMETDHLQRYQPLSPALSLLIIIDPRTAFCCPDVTPYVLSVSVLSGSHRLKNSIIADRQMDPKSAAPFLIGLEHKSRNLIG